MEGIKLLVEALKETGELCVINRKSINLLEKYCKILETKIIKLEKRIKHLEGRF